MDCESCNKARYVPQITHETDMKILERGNFRLFIACAVSVTILLASWMFFFWYRDQYMREVTEISVERHLDETWPD